MKNPVNSLEVSKRIADPVHGLIRLTEIESRVLQHPAFQRLRGITQLGMAKYVYPGAMHNRFSHSLGVLHNVNQIFDVAYRNWMRMPELSGDIAADHLFSEEVLQITRLAALCHDLGHLPFSHNMERAIDWLYQSGLIPRSFRHEHLSAVIIRKLLGDILGDYTDTIADIISGEYVGKNQNLFSSSVVSSAIDADRMDYLVRDSLNCGVDQGVFDKERLLDSILPYALDIKGKQYDVMAFRSKGVEAIEQFLLARHRMHQTIYFNPSVVGFEAGLRRAYYQITTDDPPWDLPIVYLEEPEKFIEFDEAEFYVQLKRELIRRDSWLKDPLLNRTPLRKIGPFYYTLPQNGDTDKQSEEKYAQLKKKQDLLEIPHEDWFQQDHWCYAENKKQILVNSLPRFQMASGDEDISTLKNVVFLINAHGDLIDPTVPGYGHTFLPFITGYTYHRFLYFSHKKESQRLYDELDHIIKEFEEFQTRRKFDFT